MSAYGINQSRPLSIELDGEVVRVELAGFSVRLVEDILLVDAERGGVAGLREMLQRVIGRIRKINSPVRRVQNRGYRSRKILTRYGPHLSRKRAHNSGAGQRERRNNTVAFPQ